MSETHLHNITNVLVFYMALELNDFDGPANPLLRPWKAMEGVGPGISKWICPHQNH
jgi:hypothetical protein